MNRTPEQFMERQTHQMVKTLMLDDAATAKFVPVYQNYLKELRECRMMNRKQTPARQKVEKPGVKPESKPLLTDAEVEQQIKGRFAQSRKILDVREKYYNEFRKILSSKQIMKIYQTEKSNANKLKKEFDRRKRQAAVQGKTNIRYALPKSPKILLGSLLQIGIYFNVTIGYMPIFLCPGSELHRGEIVVGECR